MPISVQIVSGPIGAGKSSLLHSIQSLTAYDPHVHVISENIGEWQYYLERMYKNLCDETVFMFQMEVTMHMHNTTKVLEQLEDKNKDTDIVVYVERAPLDVLEVFLPLNKKNLSTESYTCLETAMRKYANRPVWQNAQFFYVSCPTNVCAKRIQQRQRNGEENIDKEYMDSVTQLYNQMAKKVDAKIINNDERTNSYLQSVHLLTTRILQT